MDLSTEEIATLAIINNLKPFARAEGLERAGLGPYDADAPLIRALTQKGLLKISKTRSITADREKALAVLKRYPCPEAYRRYITNAFLYFKPSEERGNPSSTLLPWWN